ncbi:Polysaccharide biosynthesis protein [Streptococcus intermedius]|uniref:lipopolysaccharide biosynthesis protein n=1 Tax=Streptococcus intermedius TaxID=1338 RepID=UPI00055C06EF|nr:transcriptional regulator [Streptococcus intermedius]RSJ11370.1 Polysaccharide biosynthesis protein [Streptococcus intermedius]RSJ17489.1 Polysaccharide biosynthesis protein [Streptococcus intermedius]RSJ32664.1 Polysaccharide biosynthesis protein [Streptococcus intermedius]
MSQKSEMSMPSVKSNYIWNMLGTVSSSLISVVLLLLASRFLSSGDSDVFSIAYALGQQFFVLGYFQVRNLQSTDIKEKYSFASYHNTRLFTVFLMLVTSLFYVIWQSYDIYKSSIIFLLVLYRALDAYSDVFQGFFQQKNRSDLAGKIQFYRSWLCMLIFALVLLFTKSLLLASLMICFINLALTLPLDFGYYRYYFHDVPMIPFLFKDRSKVVSILKNSFPLFFNGFLLAYIYNEPKIAIDRLLTNGILPTGMQRDFNVLFMPVFVLSLLFFILRPLTTQLSIYWSEKKYSFFFKQVRLLFLVMVVLGLVIVVLGYLIGTEILGAVYGIQLQIYKVPFTLLLIGGILNVLALVVDIIMTIFRKQHYLMIAYMLTFIVSKVITLPFIRNQNLIGAANSFLISMMIFFVTSLTIYKMTKNHEKRKM